MIVQAVVARGRTVCCIAASTASSKSVMIVESPTKAIKIQKFLGDDYKVCAATAAAVVVALYGFAQRHPDSMANGHHLC